MLIDSDSILHDEVENSYLGGGAKSYDDRGLWCYQLNNDGGGRSLMKVRGATKSTLSKVSGNLIMSVVIDVRRYIS